jgi:hypothetical protein
MSGIYQVYTMIINFLGFPDVTIMFFEEHYCNHRFPSLFLELWQLFFGQINVDRSCRVIWSIVGVVCPAWSSGVDKACSSQCFDRLFVYSLLGCFEMLSSGRSIFLCSSWGQVEENSMCWCCCRLACNLLHSFQSLSWGWVWMVLWILMLFLIFYNTARKLKIFRGSSLRLSIAMDLK